MTLPVYERFITDASGNVIPLAEVELRDQDGNLPDLFLNDDGTGPTTNPATANTEGKIRVFLAPGLYNVTATGPAGTVEFEKVLLHGNIADKDEDYVVRKLDNITSLSSLNTSALVDGQQFNLTSWRPGENYGGGVLEWNPSLARSEHNGGTVFSPTVPAPSSYDEASISDYLEGAGETAPSANGCFVRRRNGIKLNELMFGAVDGWFTDMTAPIQKAIDVAGQDGVEFWGDHTVSRPINFHTLAGYVFCQSGRGSSAAERRGLRSVYNGPDAAFTMDADGAFNQGASVYNGIFTRVDDVGPVLLLRDVSDSSWFNCAFFGGSDNIHFDSDTRGCWYNQFVGCKFVGQQVGENSNNGLRFESITMTNLPNENWFSGCSFRNHGTHVNIINGTSQRFIACAFERAWEKGVVCNSRHHTFSACRFEQNSIDDVDGIILEINDLYVRVIGCEFASSTALPASRYISGSTPPHALIGANGLSSAWNTLSGDTNFRDKDGVLRLSAAGTFLYSRNGTVYRVDTNDADAIQQRNSDDSGYVTLIKLTPDDRAQMNAPIRNFLPTYADDSAAGSGGLVGGDFYKTSTGELRVKL